MVFLGLIILGFLIFVVTFGFIYKYIVCSLAEFCPCVMICIICRWVKVFGPACRFQLPRDSTPLAFPQTKEENGETKASLALFSKYYFKFKVEFFLNNFRSYFREVLNSLRFGIPHDRF